jgi:hypothetical protein
MTAEPLPICGVGGKLPTAAVSDVIRGSSSSESSSFTRLALGLTAQLSGAVHIASTDAGTPLTVPSEPLRSFIKLASEFFLGGSDEGDPTRGTPLGCHFCRLFCICRSMDSFRVMPKRFRSGERSCEASALANSNLFNEPFREGRRKIGSWEGEGGVPGRGRAFGVLLVLFEVAAVVTAFK